MNEKLALSLSGKRLADYAETPLASVPSGNSHFLVSHCHDRVISAGGVDGGSGEASDGC
jgi:hypothetical protein